jgi:preprotein translocase subunit SecA
MEKDYFILPDLGTEISKFENDDDLSNEEKLKRKDVLYQRYSESSDRIHTLHQLLKSIYIIRER